MPKPKIPLIELEVMAEIKEARKLILLHPFLDPVVCLYF